MTATVPAMGQLVLDFDGVLCDSATECLHISWASFQGFGVEAFGARTGAYAVPAEVADRYRRTRPYMRHLAHFLVPLLDETAPADRAAFAERFASLPEGMADSFARNARAYRTAVREQRRDAWLALHGVRDQVADLVEGSYIATARDRASVIEILGAHGVHAEEDRVFDKLNEKTAALGEIAERESLPPAEVFLLHDSLDDCLAVKAAGFGACWVSWGCRGPDDPAIVEAHGIPVVTLDDLSAVGRTRSRARRGPRGAPGPPGSQGAGSLRSTSPRRITDASLRTATRGSARAATHDLARSSQALVGSDRSGSNSGAGQPRGRATVDRTEPMTFTISEAHKQETRTGVRQIAMELQSEIGQRAVAYVTRNRSPKVVGRWARGEGKPQSDGAEQRLRGLYRTYLILRGPEDDRREEASTIRNWLLGANPHLGDQPPLEVLRAGDPRQVHDAAEEFVREYL